MASAGPPPRKPQLTKMQSIVTGPGGNPFAGFGEDGKICHLTPSQVGLGKECRDRAYDSATREKIFEFRSMNGQPPIFGRPCNIDLRGITFEVCALCGYGAFGQVYRIQVKGKPQKQYALKVLLARSGRRYEPDREFKVISSLETKMFDDTPRAAHIVPFRAVASNAYIQGIYRRKVPCGLVVMDFASNGELFDAIVRTDSNGDKIPNAFNSRFTRHLIRQAIFGLERLLAHGYTHRDLKPDNMLFNAQCDLVLCDLGHVKNLAEGVKEGDLVTTDRMTTMGGIGTPRYIAPEVDKANKRGIQQMQADSMKSDIWAIGITMFQLRSCICPMDVQDQLVQATFSDLDVAPKVGAGKEPNEFDVNPYKSNAAMWKKWDKFHRNISPGGSWNSTAWCRDYINEQFKPDERAFINLLLQKDPRCRVRLDLLAKAARGDMKGVPEGLAWIAKDDVPTDAEFKVEMAKRIPGFGSNQIVRKRVSIRQLDGLLVGDVSVRSKVEAAQAIINKLVSGTNPFGRAGKTGANAVEYTIDFRSDKTIGGSDEPAIMAFEDSRHRLRVLCRVHFDTKTKKVECRFSRARGDAMLHLKFMKTFDTAFKDDDDDDDTFDDAGPSAAAATGASAQIQKNTNALNKDLSLIPDGDEKDFDVGDYDLDLTDCMEDDD